MLLYVQPFGALCSVWFVCVCICRGVCLYVCLLACFLACFFIPSFVSWCRCSDERQYRVCVRSYYVLCTPRSRFPQCLKSRRYDLKVGPLTCGNFSRVSFVFATSFPKSCTVKGVVSVTTWVSPIRNCDSLGFRCPKLASQGITAGVRLRLCLHAGRPWIFRFEV